MNWPSLVLGGVALVAFVVMRVKARRWVANRWLADGLTDRQAATLFVLVYFAPVLFLTVWVVIANPTSAPTMLLTLLLIVVPVVALAGGLMDYASQHGVKERMRRDRMLRAERTPVEEGQPLVH